MLSLIVPVYCNADSLEQLVESLETMNSALGGDLEAILVVDGSPDLCAEKLAHILPYAKITSQLLVLSRNFGSFAAIRAGLAAAQGDIFAVMSADLQEPPELFLDFNEKLRSGFCDVVVGTRQNRNDPLLSRIAASFFWTLFRWLIQPEVPRGGVDVFGCTSEFRDRLLSLAESNSTLVGLIFWLGFRRQEVSYVRRARVGGRSAWTFGRKLRYFFDSCFAFTDLPIRLMTGVGAAGIFLALTLGLAVLVARLTGGITVPGYTPIVLAVLFFGGLNSLGFGILGEYLWRSFENSKRRPLYVVQKQSSFNPEGPHQ